MNKTIIMILTIVSIIYISMPVKVDALSVFGVQEETIVKANMEETLDGVMNDYNQPQNCNTLLGNPTDNTSVAWLIDKILSYLTIAGIALVVVLSSIDFAKVIVKGDDEAMAKATKRLVIRLVLAGLLFFVPTLTRTIFGLFNLTSDVTCGMQQ